MSSDLNNRPIGVFDSGLGGLTAVKELETILPGESIIYFGDTGRVPYGTKSREIIKQYTAQDIRFLQSHNVKAILAACGTVSSVAGDVGLHCGSPFFDVLPATAKAAAAATRNNRIAVIGTPATISSGSYKEELARINPDIQVFQCPCPLFVPLIESGYVSPADDLPKLVVKRSLEPLLPKKVDTLILGCTHYPIIEPIISEVLGGNVALINSGKEAALALSRYLRENNMLKNEDLPVSKMYFVSDTVDVFSSVAETFLGHSVHNLTQCIKIESY